MRITISRHTITKAMAGLTKIMPCTANSAPFKINVVSYKGIIKIYASNPNEQLIYSVGNSNNPECSFAVDAKELKEYLKQTESIKIYTFITLDDTVKAFADTDRLPEKSFKKLSIEELLYLTEQTKICKTSEDVLKYIQQAVPSVSKDPTAGVINNILLNSEGVAATDKNELVCFSCETGIKDNVLLPVTKILSSGVLTGNETKISTGKFNTNTYCVFVTDFWEYSVKTQCGIYPDYKNVIPEQYPNSIEISPEDINYLLKSVPLLESTSKHKTIHLYIGLNKKELSILSENLISPVLKIAMDCRCGEINQPLIISMKKDILLRALNLGFNKFSFDSGFSPVLATTKANNSKMVFMPLKGNFDAKKIEDKINKKLYQGEYTQVQNTDVKQEDRQTLHREKSSGNEKVTQTKNKPFIKKEVKMTKPVQNKPDPDFTGHQEKDSMEQVFENISTLKNRAKELSTLAVELSKQVKEIQKAKKSREREFKTTREILVKLQKVSNF